VKSWNRVSRQTPSQAKKESGFNQSLQRSGANQQSKTNWPNQTMKTLSLILILLACQGSLVSAPAQAASEPALSSLQFLVGRWEGEGTADVGAGSGYFTFENSLQSNVLIRKNHSEYPATAERPTFIHDDLMVIYVDQSTKQIRAFYTDSEKHVINYVVNVGTDGKKIVFLSEPERAAPQYRLSYGLLGPGKMSVSLEARTPDKPDQFQKVVEGRVKKVS
jgi:hypothetical protein